MALTGKYDFDGIKSKGADGLKLLLASSPVTAWIPKIPMIDTIIEPLINWAANNGLVLLNLGAIFVNGKIDQNKLDSALDAGIKEVELPGNTITPERAKEIDDAVIKAADSALPYTR